MTDTMAHRLDHLVEQLALFIQNQEEPDQSLYSWFLQEPETALHLVDYLQALPEEEEEEEALPLYSAALFALDLCVAQFHAAEEAGNKLAGKMLVQIMNRLAETILTAVHGLGFWLPVLNAFYEVHIELTPALKNAYMELAMGEEDAGEIDESTHLDSIRDLLQELADLSDFDIAENFFAQSYAMPPEFFADLTVDLYNTEEGQDVALLGLLHPVPEVRYMVIATLDQLMDTISLSPTSLSRLQAIMHWYPESDQPQFQRWIKLQRKKGAVFLPEPIPPQVEIQASEVDGMGAQGIFVQFQNKRKYRLGGILVKYQLGLKDAWITPELSKKEVVKYYQEAFDQSITLRAVDLDYLILIAEHFLALTIQQGETPDIHLLAFQEALGLQLRPKFFDVAALLEDLGVAIHPYTPEVMEESLQRSRQWPKTKQFTESWYEENSSIDKLVNRCCSYIDGVKVCRFDEAMALVFKEEMELHRDKWLFHFLWIALWAKASARKNEKLWQDSYFIAQAIAQGYSLDSIPLMQEICRQSVINSVETMQERRTYLHKE